MDEAASFGFWVRRRRKTLDLTQAELGARIGVSLAMIRRLEADERRPSRETAARLAQVLEVPPSERDRFLRVARAELAPDNLPSTPVAAVGMPVLAFAERYSTSLPVPTTPLVGREAEAGALCKLLQPPGARLITLTGAGGTGKTRLALHVAASLRDAFAAGACFVDLAPMRDPALVPSALAGALGVKEVPGQPLIETLQLYLRDKQLLLVLDNFEHLLSAARLMADLLRAAPGLTVLVTSRAVLHLYGEQEHAVPPLALPEPTRLPPLEQLRQIAAVQLFIQRARLVKPDFDLTSENATAVAQVCARLDGLPLALELAAARMKLLTPQALLTRLEHSLNLLTGGARDLPARQQTMRATIAWSYNLLAVTEQRLCARLAVFAGGCTVEAAEAVCHAGGDWEGDVLDGLAALVDKSLVQHTEGTSGESRFTMLETIREFAVEQLGQADSHPGPLTSAVEATRRAHAHYYLTLAETAEPHLVGPEEVTWHNRLEQEHGNLRAALRWTLAPTANAEQRALGLRLAGAVWWFWRKRGYHSEGRQWLEALLRRDTVLPIAVSDALRAKALLGAGRLALDQGDYVAGTARYEESLALCRQGGDLAGAAWSLDNLGWVRRNQGDYAAGTALCEESLALFRKIGDKRGMATALFNLSLCAGMQGDHVRAEALAEQTVPLFRDVGDNGGLGWSLWGLGASAMDRGDALRARGLFEDAATRFRALGDPLGLAASLSSLGALAASQGNEAWAVALYEECLAIRRVVGGAQETLPGNLPEVLERLGELAHKQGDDARARRLFRESLAVYRELDQGRHSHDRATRCLMRLAGATPVRVEQGTTNHARRATRLFGAAEALSKRVGSAWAPFERAAMERNVAAARTQLGAVTFAAVWAEGQAMTLEQAIAYALETEG